MEEIIMMNLNFNETMFEGYSEEQIKEALYKLYLNKVDIKKPLTNLAKAREYFRRIINGKNYPEIYSKRNKIWDDVKSQVREYYGVDAVKDIPEDKLEEANNMAQEIIDQLLTK
jgi:hypothetical protein